MVPRPANTANHGRPRPSCTRHHLAVDGGPVLYWCPAGHSVYAADLDNDFQAVTR